MTKELKPNPCRFCRMHGSVKVPADFNSYCVECNICEVKGPYRQTIAGAIKAWNLMHPPRKERK